MLMIEIILPEVNVHIFSNLFKGSEFLLYFYV